MKGEGSSDAGSVFNTEDALQSEGGLYLLHEAVLPQALAPVNRAAEKISCKELGRKVDETDSDIPADDRSGQNHSYDAASLGAQEGEGWTPRGSFGR